MSDEPEDKEDAAAPNPAQQLARRRWDKETPEERKANAEKAFKKRWQGNPEGLLEYMRTIASRPRPKSKGRLRIKERCPCGKYSATLAAKRGHKCSPPAPEV